MRVLHSGQVLSAAAIGARIVKDVAAREGDALVAGHISHKQIVQHASSFPLLLLALPPLAASNVLSDEISASLRPSPARRTALSLKVLRGVHGPNARDILEEAALRTPFGLVRKPRTNRLVDGCWCRQWHRHAGS